MSEAIERANVDAKQELVLACNHQRDLIGALDKDVLALKPHISNCVKGTDCGEAISNVMLAHRHLEDARMRLGKVIQAIEGGVSILDHPDVKALIAKIRSGG